MCLCVCPNLKDGRTCPKMSKCWTRICPSEILPDWHLCSFNFNTKLSMDRVFVGLCSPTTNCIIWLTTCDLLNRFSNNRFVLSFLINLIRFWYSLFVVVKFGKQLWINNYLCMLSLKNFDQKSVDICVLTCSLNA